MEPQAPRPARIRILATGWRLASAEAVFALGGVLSAVLAVVSALVSATAPAARFASTMWAITLAVAGLFTLLVAALLLSCRWIVIDVPSRRLLGPGDRERSLAGVRAIAASGRSGQTVAGSGRPYRYTVWSLDAWIDETRREARGPVLDHRARAGAPPGGVVSLVDAATRRRAERIGRRVAAALDVPFLDLGVQAEGRTVLPPGSPPP